MILNGYKASCLRLQKHPKYDDFHFRLLKIYEATKTELN